MSLEYYRILLAAQARSQELRRQAERERLGRAVERPRDGHGRWGSAVDLLRHLGKWAFRLGQGLEPGLPRERGRAS